MTRACLTRGRSRFLNTVLRSRGPAVDNTGQIKGTTNTLVLDTRQIGSTSSSNQNNTMLLCIMAFTRDECSDHFSVGKLHTTHFSVRRVGFFRLHSHYTNNHTSSLRAVVQSRSTRLLRFFLLLHCLENASTSENLINGSIAACVDGLERGV